MCLSPREFSTPFQHFLSFRSQSDAKPIVTIHTYIHITVPKTQADVRHFLSRLPRPSSSQNFPRYFVFTYLSEDVYSHQFHTHTTIRNNSQIWSKRHTRICIRVAKATYIFLCWFPSWMRFKSRFKHSTDTFNYHEIIPGFHEIRDVR
jgi:hypothetical protein